MRPKERSEMFMDVVKDEIKSVPKEEKDADDIKTKADVCGGGTSDETYRKESLLSFDDTKTQTV